MRYIEELSPGESFRYGGCLYIVTSDFRNNGSRLCYSLSSGTPKWMNSNDTVEIDPIYCLDTNNNLTPIFAYEKTDT